jgi:hypothetical protein
MKAIISLLMLLLTGGLVVGAGGCASNRYSEESYNQPQVLHEYIRTHPEYYQEWRNEIPSG